MNIIGIKIIIRNWFKKIKKWNYWILIIIELLSIKSYKKYIWSKCQFFVNMWYYIVWYKKLESSKCNCKTNIV